MSFDATSVSWSIQLRLLPGHLASCGPFVGRALPFHPPNPQTLDAQAETHPKSLEPGCHMSVVSVTGALRRRSPYGVYRPYLRPPGPRVHPGDATLTGPVAPPPANMLYEEHPAFVLHGDEQNLEGSRSMRIEPTIFGDRTTLGWIPGAKSVGASVGKPPRYRADLIDQQPCDFDCMPLIKGAALAQICNVML